MAAAAGPLKAIGGVDISTVQIKMLGFLVPVHNPVTHRGYSVKYYGDATADDDDDAPRRKKAIPEHLWELEWPTCHCQGR